MTVLLCTSTVSAQSEEPDHAVRPSRVYARVGAGYGFVHAGETELNGNGISGSGIQAGNVYSREVKQASFGSGVSATIAGGYMITQHLGVELGIQATLAPVKYSYSDYVPNFGNSRRYTTETYAKLPVYIIPALLLTTGTKLQLYGRGGIVIPLSDKMTQEETRTGVGPGQSTQVFARALENRFSIGLQGAAGLAYRLSNHLSVWGEASGISRNAYIKRAEITTYTEDGLNALGSYSTNQKVTEYEFNYDVSSQPPATEPNKQSTFAIPFGTIGLSVGVKYAF